MASHQIELIDRCEYYILLGMKMGVYKPLFFDMINLNHIKDCVQSQNIGTLFINKNTARKAKDVLLIKYPRIKVAKLVIIGEYRRERK